MRVETAKVKFYGGQTSGLLDNLPLMPESQCSYFDDRLSRSRVFKWRGDMPVELFEIALRKGFRRCGDTYYQFNCRACQLCLGYRIVIEKFHPSRSQRRVLHKNQDVESIVKKPELTCEKEEIYLRYQSHQHYGDNAGCIQKDRPFNRDELLETMHYQMYSNPAWSREIELFLNGNLIGFGILDIGVHSASAVYLVFDPNFSKRSLGTLGILRGIEWADFQGLTYYYLGFYIPNHPKMEYKKRFGEAEILNRNTNHWDPDLPDGDVRIADEENRFSEGDVIEKCIVRL